jgi:chemotaxis methyl-accepting protein methylase
MFQTVQMLCHKLIVITVLIEEKGGDCQEIVQTEQEAYQLIKDFITRLYVYKTNFLRIHRHFQLIKWQPSDMNLK